MNNIKRITCIFISSVLAVLATFVLAGQPVSAEVKIPDKPINGIYDPHDYIGRHVEKKIVDLNNRYANTKEKPQIGVYVVDTLDGRDIDSVSLEVAQKWEIGDEKTNNGILVAIAIKDREYRIEASNNIATNYISNSQAQSILDDGIVKQKMRTGNYSRGLSLIINKIDQRLQGKQEETSFSNALKAFVATLSLSFLVLVYILLVAGWKMRQLKRNFLKRSQYDYYLEDKLTPNRENFVENDSWTEERVAHFWEEYYRKCSDYSYKGRDKLYPEDEHFIDNESWTVEHREEYNLDKLDRERRSKYDYEGDDKLYPDDDGFVANSTWTYFLINSYHKEKPPSSSSWGGGGFTGNGASGGW